MRVKQEGIFVVQNLNKSVGGGIKDKHEEARGGTQARECGLSNQVREDGMLLLSRGCLLISRGYFALLSL